MNRRDIFCGAAGLGLSLLAPETVLAARAAKIGGDWSLGFQDLEADVARGPMRRLHGRAPGDLSGTLFRNGPAKFRRPGGSVEHWFDGDGLIRAFRFDAGEATFEARFVDTAKRRQESAANAVVTGGFGTRMRPGGHVTGNDDVNAANISVLPVGGELWALWEAGSPTVLDPQTLATRGLRTLRPDLAGMPFLAHPRIEPDGRIWNLGVGGDRAVVWRLGADGALQAADFIQLTRASYIHDFTATKRHLILVLQPWIQARNSLPQIDGLEWRPGEGGRILVLDKADLSRRRIYETPAFFCFHMTDAWETPDGEIVFDVCATSNPDFAVRGARDVLMGRDDRDIGSPEMTRIRLGRDGKAQVLPLGFVAEFPRADPRIAGTPRRFTSFATHIKHPRPLFQAVAVRDERNERNQVFDFGPRQMVEEPMFAPRAGSGGEFEGWLLVPTVNLDAGACELHVFEARNVAAGPICAWRASAVAPVGLHGAFVSACHAWVSR